MSKFKKILIFELFVIALLIFTYCNEHKKSETNNPSETAYTLGSASLQVTGNEEAIPHFEKGLLLLHSFEYWDAEDAFKEAQKADSSMVMAYWGEAMTYNHGLWRGQNYEKAVSCLKKLGETPEERAARAETDLEKDLLQSIEILYGEGTKFERDQAYSNYLGNLYEKYPENQEIAAFYALSLLGSVKEGRDDEVYEKGAVVAQGILKENPSHPGALHYLIHSYDDPNNAFKALEAANSYSVVAKDAGHALHMPSHIYVAMGMWDEVVSSNEASYAASVERMERKDLDNNARGYHAFHWLQYGYLQKGRFEDARNLLKDMNQYTDELPSPRARYHQIAMTGTYMVETGDWKDENAKTEIKVDDLNVSARTLYAFVKGMNQYAEGDAEGLGETIDAILEDIKIATGKMESRSVEGCSGNWKYSYPSQTDINQSTVMQMELKALLAKMNGDDASVDEWLSKATELESNTSYSYGPPAITKPSWELYGEWLLEKERYEEAITQFEYSLNHGPKRILSLKGIQKAYEGSGQQEKAAEVAEEINEILSEGMQV